MARAAPELAGLPQPAAESTFQGDRVQRAIPRDRRVRGLQQLSSHTAAAEDDGPVGEAAQQQSRTGSDGPRSLPGRHHSASFPNESRRSISHPKSCIPSQGVVAAEQRAGKVGPGLMHGGDLLIQGLEPSPADGLPFVHVGCVEDAGDLTEGQSGDLEHPDEREAC